MTHASVVVTCTCSRISNIFRMRDGYVLIILFNCYCKFGKELGICAALIKTYGKRCIIALVDLVDWLFICYSILIGCHFEKIIILVITGRNSFRSNADLNVSRINDIAAGDISKLCCVLRSHLDCGWSVR